MAKKVTGYLKLQVPAGAANPSPPIGPALGFEFFWLIFLQMILMKA
jgi:hypothetical protein